MDIVMISKNIIERHRIYKKYAKAISPHISRGTFWQTWSKKFSTKINKDGYQRKGNAQDYLPDSRYWPKYLLKEYYYGLIMQYIEYQPKVVMDIGAGGGHLAGLFHLRCSSKIIIVDLPEMIVLSSAFFLQMFPQSRIVLPNETDREKADVIMLHPDQTDFLGENQVDLAINTASFMEMDLHEVEHYFALIDRCLKVGGYFYCSNKDKKVTAFNEYPWQEYNNYQDIYYEKCGFTYNRTAVFWDRLIRKLLV
jgi:putative sugar O-methyltransferase